MAYTQVNPAECTINQTKVSYSLGFFAVCVFMLIHKASLIAPTHITVMDKFSIQCGYDK